MSKPIYRCTQSELYAVARAGWASFLNFLVSFTAFNSNYTAAFAGARLDEIDAAEDLPDEAARAEAHRLLRLTLIDKRILCTQNWQKLARYITAAYPFPQTTVMLDSAGQQFYEQAADNNWDVVLKLMKDGSKFIQIHLAALTGAGMPSGFQASFNLSRSSFKTTYEAFIAAEEQEPIDSDIKTDANNLVHDKLMMMFLDGQQIFINDDEIKKQFTFTSVLELVSAPGAGGFKGIIFTTADSSPVPNAKLTFTRVVPIAGESPSVIFSDTDGKYAISLPEDKYNILIEKIDFTSVTLSNQKVVPGVNSILNIGLVPL